MNNAPREFQDSYADRLSAARDAKRAGRRVIGYVGPATPVELIAATGAFPLLVTASPKPPSAASARYVEAEIEPEIRSLFDRVWSGAYEFLDLLIIPASCDGYLTLYAYLSEVTRLGDGARVPPLYLYDLLHAPTAEVRGYSWTRTLELRRRIEAAAGAPIDDDRLRKEIVAANARRRAIIALSDLRRTGRVSGIAALHAIGASYFSPADDYAARLTAFTARAAANPPLPGPRILLAPASPLYHDRLHHALESAGAVIIGEDDWFGDRAAEPTVAAGDTPIEALFDAYYSGAPGPRLPRTTRDRWLFARAARGDIDAVVFYIPSDDQHYGWSYPGFRKSLEERAVPSLLLRQDVLNADGFSSISTAAAQFFATLRAGRRP